MTPLSPPPSAQGRAVPALSVIVPTYQRRESVLRLCSALDRQTVPAESFEVVVSIDGSDDGTREALNALTTSYPLRTLWRRNGGRAAALNAGIDAAAGDLIVFLDDDMEPAPGLLHAHRVAHADGGRRGVMGAVPVRIEPAAPPATRYVGMKFNAHLENLARAGYSWRLTDFYSGNFSVRREVLLEVGGFDEEFRVYGNEDLELSLRLSNAGVALAYEPAALAVQHNDKDFAALARDSTAEGRTAVLLARKHPAAFAELKLGSFRSGPRALLLLRNVLLALTRLWQGVPDTVVGVERVLARSRLPPGPSFYRLALGYFFWLGAAAALHEVRVSPGEDGRLVGLAGDLGA